MQIRLISNKRTQLICEMHFMEGKMLYVGITKKMKDKFKLATEKVDILEVDKLTTWHANIFTFQRKTGAIFMNDTTRYSIILFGLKKADFSNLEEIMKTQLRKNMKADGFNDFEIQAFTRSFDKITFTNTSNRSVLGQMRDHLFALTFHIYSDDILTEELIQEVNNRINDTPMSALEREGFKPFPVYALKSVLGKEK